MNKSDLIELEEVTDTSVIPEGDYCYGKTRVVRKKSGEVVLLQTERCPYWFKAGDGEYQLNGYCQFLQFGDWQAEEGISLLWDQVKECEVNCGE